MLRRHGFRSLAAAGLLVLLGQSTALPGGKAPAKAETPDSTSGPVSASAPADSAAARPAGDASAGKKLFTSKGCVACHKANGSGGIKLTGNPTPDWRDAERMNDPAHDDAYLRDCILHGKPKSGMVPWEKQIKPQQVEDLIAYIRTFSAEKRKK